MLYIYCFRQIDGSLRKCLHFLIYPLTNLTSTGQFYLGCFFVGMAYRSSITKALEQGTTIVCDRYAFSGIAFSAAKVTSPPVPSSSHSTEDSNPSPTKLNPVLSYEWCRAPDISLPAPDLTFFLDVSPAKAEQRGGFGNERYEKKEMQERVRLVFDRIAEEVEGSGVGKWVVLDADLEKEEVEQSVWDEVKVLVEGGVQEPIRKLWDGTREAAMVDALYI